MPDPQRLLTTIGRATDAIRGQPGRRGRYIEIQDAADVLVAGDLHGNIGNFEAIHKAADLAGHPRRHLVLQEIVHGKARYPLGGDKSHQLIDLFSALKNQFPDRVHLLMGNHELAQWSGRPIMKAEEDLNALFIRGVTEAYGESAAAIDQAYHQIFALLPLAIRLPNRVFLSHSLPIPKFRDDFSLALLEQDGQPPHAFAAKGVLRSLLWGRDCSEENTAAFLRLVDCDYLVTGHILCDHGFATPNEQQIILDCCSSPAAYAIIPADRPLTRHEFYATVRLI